MIHKEDLLRAAQIVKNEAGYTHSTELTALASRLREAADSVCVPRELLQRAATYMDWNDSARSIGKELEAMLAAAPGGKDE